MPRIFNLGLLRKSVNKLYLAGDHKQPALVSDKGEKMEYGRSIMQRLMELRKKMFLKNWYSFHHMIA